MELNIYVVDAFTDKQFKGNSAAVVPLVDWLQPEVMQSIAAENNLSETAFIKKTDDNQYEIRWFSPLIEIDFCGHATLASSFVLFNVLNVVGDIEFITLEVGNLTVKRDDDGRIEMSFPNQCPESVIDIPSPIISGLSIKPIQVLRNRQAYVAVLATKQDVLDVQYDVDALKLLAPRDLVVTASACCNKGCQGNDLVELCGTSDLVPATDIDFVSRYFWPASGGHEDPVTGSIHSGLAPYWASVLGKTSLTAYQASSRGGLLYCRVEGERVFVSGYGVLYLQGKIFI